MALRVLKKVPYVITVTVVVLSMLTLGVSAFGFKITQAHGKTYIHSPVP